MYTPTLYAVQGFPFTHFSVLVHNKISFFGGLTPTHAIVLGFFVHLVGLMSFGTTLVG